MRSADLLADSLIWSPYGLPKRSKGFWGDAGINKIHTWLSFGEINIKRLHFLWTRCHISSLRQIAFPKEDLLSTSLTPLFFGISAAAKSFWPGGRKGESWPSYFLLIYSDAHRWTVAQKICKNQKIKKSTNIPVKDTKKHTHPTAVQRWGENIKARYLFSESSILLDVS